MYRSSRVKSLLKWWKYNDKYLVGLILTKTYRILIIVIPEISTGHSNSSNFRPLSRLLYWLRVDWMKAVYKARCSKVVLFILSLVISGGEREYWEFGRYKTRSGKDPTSDWSRQATGEHPAMTFNPAQKIYGILYIKLFLVNFIRVLFHYWCRYQLLRVIWCTVGLWIKPSTAIYYMYVLCMTIHVFSAWFTLTQHYNLLYPCVRKGYLKVYWLCSFRVLVYITNIHICAWAVSLCHRRFSPVLTDIGSFITAHCRVWAVVK